MTHQECYSAEFADLCYDSAQAKILKKMHVSFDHVSVLRSNTEELLLAKERARKFSLGEMRIRMKSAPEN